VEVVHMDRIKVLQHLSAADVKNDISALITTQDKLSDVHIKLTELKNQLADLETAIHQLGESKGKIAFEEASLVSMEKIEAVFKASTETTETDNVYLAQSEYKIRLGEGEIKLRQAENRDWISFFQVTYETNEDIDEWEHRTSVEVGFKLPVVAADKEDIWRRKANLTREKMQYEAAKREVSAESSQLRHETLNLMAQYQLLKERRENGSAVTILNRQLTVKGADPLDLLKLKESILENDIRLAERAFTIRSNYIELMELTGRLARKPLTDYLANKLERLGPQKK